ncbi:MAG: anaerobic ribonucleoside-triphosphate reductase activating protein [Peptoniphilus sp.]|nr:anaerobic ribonucleoside-triphosphate reductase activating protein [Peptoniphilus sp.]MDD7363181.1 anaerobic ribonucleoside-triphosphate reductase activating protein [Bacillota bacterium]MDY6044495.1 anaerobic ribonucleoside-triphosphate reductase activating protein [Peptoniphilus sp.]
MTYGRYAQIRPLDIANGNGIRVSVFVTGCSHHCKNCFNEPYQDPRYGERWSEETTRELIAYLSRPEVAGLTLLGGEPMENTWLADVLETVRKAVDKSVWIYSGYTFEEILEDPDKKRLLALCDVLVDGPFIEELKNLKLAFRGSENQRILDVQKSLEQNAPVEAPKKDTQQ